MADDSLYPPQARRRRRSRSHLFKPLPPLPHEDVDTSYSPRHSVSPTVSFYPTSRPTFDLSCPVSPIEIVNLDLTQMIIGNPPDSAYHSRHQDQPSQNQMGMFSQARDFTVTGTFVDGNVTYNNASSNQFMRELLERAIPGAAFDSSDRDPPPRCHPGTRLAVLERCLYFISHCNGVQKIHWIVGAAGVGKSAIMQSVAESPELQVDYHASVFFSINGRSDGTKVIMTLAYQLAAKSEPYRQLIEENITRDPSILRSSMSGQFNTLIVRPFIHKLKSVGRVLIVLDGLDECKETFVQKRLLRLISDFCVMYPFSPLVWLIASRPETHITSFFAQQDVIPTFEKEEIIIDSNEARADVERFLRDKLAEIKDTLDSLDPHWPYERDIWKLANAAGGLFAYAQAVIRYIGDSTITSPVSQLSDVLHVIDQHAMTDISKEEHPMALLDALYDRIVSNVPAKIMVNTRKLLMALTHRNSFVPAPDTDGNFIALCNWLGMTPDDAYAALNHLRSVLDVPLRDKAHKDLPRPFHKSFFDYISEYTRSGFSRDIKHEAQELESQYALRVLNQAPDGIDLGDVDYKFRYGTLSRGPGTGDQVSLSWPVEEGGDWNDDETKLWMYKMAVGEAVDGMRRGDPIFLTESCIRLLTTVFRKYCDDFLHYAFRDRVFEESRRLEFMMSSILEQVPLNIIAKPDKYAEVKLQFRRPLTAIPHLSNPWKSSCPHEREGEWDEGNDQDWKTTFWEDDCGCFVRFQDQLADLKDRSPHHTVVMLFTSTAEHCVELRFVDPEDGVSEWTYWFWVALSSEDRQKYVRPVRVYD